MDIPPTLAGHLAQSGWFSRRGELACTFGLHYLLDDDLLNALFAELLSERTGRPGPGQLFWKVEQKQPDGGRPDLEGRTADDLLVVKIEAKLSAAFGWGQLNSYLNDLAVRLDGREEFGILVVLVPEYRIAETKKELDSCFAKTPSGGWELAGHQVLVITWKELLDAMAAAAEGATDGPLVNDIVQLRGMCATLGGIGLPVLTDLSLGSDWAEQSETFETLAARCSERLNLEVASAAPNEPFRLLPLGRERSGYVRRYVCHPDVGKPICFSIGVRNPLPGTSSPIVLRYHKATGAFSEIAGRLKKSRFGPSIMPEDGHLWIPLECKAGIASEKVVDDLVEQARAIDCVARSRP